MYTIQRYFNENWEKIISSTDWSDARYTAQMLSRVSYNKACRVVYKNVPYICFQDGKEIDLNSEDWIMAK